MANASLFVDDIGAWEEYERDESENKEVRSIFILYITNYLIPLIGTTSEYPWLFF